MMHCYHMLQDLDIAITPHLDDGLEYGGWRNALVFDPLEKYGGFSYYEVRVHAGMHVCMLDSTARPGCAMQRRSMRAPDYLFLLLTHPTSVPHPQVMLKPIAQALNAVIQPTTQAWFAMQGACQRRVCNFLPGRCVVCCRAWQQAGQGSCAVLCCAVHVLPNCCVLVTFFLRRRDERHSHESPPVLDNRYGSHQG